MSGIITQDNGIPALDRTQTYVRMARSGRAEILPAYKAKKLFNDDSAERITFKEYEQLKEDEGAKKNRPQIFQSASVPKK
jgi:hypothetical protein